MTSPLENPGYSGLARLVSFSRRPSTSTATVVAAAASGLGFTARLLRALVQPDGLEHRMAEPPAVRPLGERDFGDEHRLGPHRGPGVGLGDRGGERTVGTRDGGQGVEQFAAVVVS